MKSIQRGWQYLVSLNSTRASLLIFLFAFVVRLAFVVVFRPYRDLSRFELERVAISLATTGVYGNPYALPTGPSAHVSPGYTLLLAGLFRIFGTGTAAEIIKEVLASGVSSMQCALFPLVASRLLGNRRAGIIAGLICALYPCKPLVQIDGAWEAPYTALFLMLLSVLTASVWKERNATPKNAFVHGFSWGFALLFVSALLPLFLVFLAVGAYLLRGSGFRRYLSFVSIEVLIVAICLAPWAIRNFYALGAPIITRSNFGLEMRLSNNDLAGPNERANQTRGLYQIYHPLQNPKEALKVRYMGEVAYNKQALNQAKEWIRTHPWAFLKLSLERVRWFWFFTDPTSPMKTLFLDVTVLMGLGGLLCVLQLERTTGIVLALILLIYPTPNYLIHVGLRQKYPVDWIMVLLTVVLLLQWSERLSKMRGRSMDPKPSYPI